MIKEGSYVRVFSFSQHNAKKKTIMSFFNKKLLDGLLSINIQLNKLNNNYLRSFLENIYDKKFQIKLLFVNTMSLIFMQKLWLKIEILYLIKIS